LVAVCPVHQEAGDQQHAPVLFWQISPSAEMTSRLKRISRAAAAIWPSRGGLLGEGQAESVLSACCAAHLFDAVRLDARADAKPMKDHHNELV
jgi:hypothetical protein